MKVFSLLLLTTAFALLSTGCRKDDDILKTPNHKMYDYFKKYTPNSWWLYERADTAISDTARLMGNVWQIDNNTREQNLDAQMMFTLHDDLDIRVVAGKPYEIYVGEGNGNGAVIAYDEETDAYKSADDNCSVQEIPGTHQSPDGSMVVGTLLRVTLKKGPLKEFTLLYNVGILSKTYEINGQTITYILTDCQQCH